MIMIYYRVVLTAVISTISGKDIILLRTASFSATTIHVFHPTMQPGGKQTV